MLERLLCSTGLCPRLLGFGKVGEGEFSAGELAESIAKNPTVCGVLTAEALAPVYTAANRHTNNNLQLFIS